MIRRIKEKWKTVWNFEKKMYFTMVAAISVLTMAAIVVSVVSSVTSASQRNRRYVSEQLDTMAEDYAENLNQYKSLVVSLVLDEHVQEYCDSRLLSESFKPAGEVSSVLLTFLYMQSNSNFFAVTNDRLDTYVYSGNFSLQGSNFEKSVEEDYPRSLEANEAGSIRMSFSNRFTKDGKYNLTLYFPVYSVEHMVSSNGLVIVNLNDNILERFQNKDSMISGRIFLTSVDGTVVSTSDTEQIGEEIPYAEKMTANVGEFWYKGRKINYRRVGDWKYYLVCETESIELYRDVIGTVAALLLIMLGSMAAVLTVVKRAVGMLYRPINKMVAKMNTVSDGKLGTRIHTIEEDSDSRKLAEGFNRMMDEIDVLMGQVKEEERQMTQVRLNALQSQIQPHFLYNTLECIHWQAAANGDREASVMVKALAQYYRICLSGGEDMITLKTELEHVRNYIIIQNMRYDNIIDLQIEVEEQYQAVRIPKMTLQPLVENSIYHGLRVKDGKKGIVRISASRKGEKILVTVQDNGQGMSKEKIELLNRNIREFDRKTGYGTNNVNKRLELTFGPAFGLHFEAVETGGLLATICLPDIT